MDYSVAPFMAAPIVACIRATLLIDVEAPRTAPLLPFGSALKPTMSRQRRKALGSHAGHEADRKGCRTASGTPLRVDTGETRLPCKEGQPRWYRGEIATSPAWFWAANGIQVAPS